MACSARAPVGTAPGTWPGDKGYVGGTLDAATSLENLGAREYDSLTGRFISLDPLFEATSPQQFNGYDYAGNNPVTSSDPTGQVIPNGDSGGPPCTTDCNDPVPAPVDTNLGGLGTPAQNPIYSGGNEGVMYSGGDRSSGQFMDGGEE
jgi:RHS repeat-associated protein